MNYLPLAKRSGAEIYTCAEVDYIRAADQGGYFVYFRRHHQGMPAEGVVHARAVMLGAGVMGTTGILLRSRARGLSLSKRLGHHFSGNGDQLGFGYNTDHRTDVLGFGDHPNGRVRNPVGPTISSMIDFRDRPAQSEQFILEEGAIPRALVETIRRVSPGLALLGRDTDTGWQDRAAEIARIIRDNLPRDPEGAANHSIVYLGMGHDGADGRIILDHEGRPKVIWDGLAERRVFQLTDEGMYRLVEALGGTYVSNPRWGSLLGRNLITVHPLGGCPMGEDADSGVVNHAGQAFDPDGRSGDGLHPGLFVVDGSILPTSVGVNPLLTISTLAERVADHVVRQGPAAFEPVEGPLTLPVPRVPPVGLEFTEVMKGYFTTRVRDAQNAAEYKTAVDAGRNEGSFLVFKLTIIIDDLQAFLESKEHEARAEGYVDSRAFGHKRRVEEGSFNLFITDERQQTKRMRYALKFLGEDGGKYRLEGFKEVRADTELDAWPDNTTLYTTIRKGWDDGETVVGQGVLYIQVPDFLKQLTTFHVRNSPAPAADARWLGRFGHFFFGELWDTYIRHQVPGRTDT